MKSKVFIYLIITFSFQSCFIHPNLYKKKYYTENNYFINALTLELSQKLYYDRPRIIDEEITYSLRFKILDTSAARTKKILDLTTDSSIISVQYTILAPWRVYSNNKVSGQIEIIKWNKNEIIIEENIMATNTKLNKTMQFVGKYLFEKYSGDYYFKQKY